MFLITFILLHALSASDDESEEKGTLYSEASAAGMRLLSLHGRIYGVF